MMRGALWTFLVVLCHYAVVSHAALTDQPLPGIDQNLPEPTRDRTPPPIIDAVRLKRVLDIMRQNPSLYRRDLGGRQVSAVFLGSYDQALEGVPAEDMSFFKKGIVKHMVSAGHHERSYWAALDRTPQAQARAPFISRLVREGARHNFIVITPPVHDPALGRNLPLHCFDERIQYAENPQDINENSLEFRTGCSIVAPHAIMLRKFFQCAEPILNTIPNKNPERPYPHLYIRNLDTKAVEDTGSFAGDNSYPLPVYWGMLAQMSSGASDWLDRVLGYDGAPPAGMTEKDLRYYGRLNQYSPAELTEADKLAVIGHEDLIFSVAEETVNKLSKQQASDILRGLGLQTLSDVAFASRMPRRKDETLLAYFKRMAEPDAVAGRSLVATLEADPKAELIKVYMLLLSQVALELEGQDVLQDMDISDEEKQAGSPGPNADAQSEKKDAAAKTEEKAGPAPVSPRRGSSAPAGCGLFSCLFGGKSKAAAAAPVAVPARSKALASELAPVAGSVEAELVATFTTKYWEAKMGGRYDPDAVKRLIKERRPKKYTTFWLKSQNIYDFGPGARNGAWCERHPSDCQSESYTTQRTRFRDQCMFDGQPGAEGRRYAAQLYNSFRSITATFATLGKIGHSTSPHDDLWTDILRPEAQFKFTLHPVCMRAAASFVNHFGGTQYISHSEWMQIIVQARNARNPSKLEWRGCRETKGSMCEYESACFRLALQRVCAMERLCCPTDAVYQECRTDYKSMACHGGISVSDNDEHYAYSPLSLDAAAQRPQADGVPALAPDHPLPGSPIIGAHRVGPVPPLVPAQWRQQQASAAAGQQQAAPPVGQQQQQAGRQAGGGGAPPRPSYRAPSPPSRASLQPSSSPIPGIVSMAQGLGSLHRPLKD